MPVTPEHERPKQEDCQVYLAKYSLALLFSVIAKDFPNVFGYFFLRLPFIFNKIIHFRVIFIIIIIIIFIFSLPFVTSREGKSLRTYEQK
jgi:uncharacterized membrane protein